MPYRLVLVILVTSARVANAQYGNFGGPGWSGGQWNANLNQMASTPPTKLPGDAQFKQHDIDFATRNVAQNGGIFGQQGMKAHKAMYDRVTGNHYHVPAPTTP